MAKKPSENILKISTKKSNEVPNISNRASALIPYGIVVTMRPLYTASDSLSSKKTVFITGVNKLRRRSELFPPETRHTNTRTARTDGATANERQIGAPSEASFARLRDGIRKRGRKHNFPRDPASDCPQPASSAPTGKRQHPQCRKERRRTPPPTARRAVHRSRCKNEHGISYPCGGAAAFHGAAAGVCRTG